MEDYEDEKFIYTVVRTDTQGSPCAPFYSMQVKPGTIERAGLFNTLKAALESHDRQAAKLNDSYEAQAKIVWNMRRAKDPTDRPGLMDQERIDLFAYYKKRYAPETWAAGRAMLIKQFEEYAAKAFPL